MTDLRSRIPGLGADVPAAPRDVQAVPMSTATRPQQAQDRPDIPSILWAHRVLGRTDRLDADRERLRQMYAPVMDHIRADTHWYDRVDSPEIDIDPDRGEAKVWAYINDRRRTDPTYLADIAPDPKKLATSFDQQTRADRDTARFTIGNERGFVDKAIGFATDVYENGIDPILHGDPATAATYAIGGGGSTVASRIAIDALAQGAVSAASQPFVAHNRAQVGETLTPEEAGENVALAAATGGLIRGAHELAAAGARAVVAPARRLADGLRSRIGWDRMTDPEKAATVVLDREADTLAIDPTEPGAGSATHLARMDAAEARLATPTADLPRLPDPPAPSYAGTPFADVKQRIMGRESRGDYNIVVYSTKAPEPITGMTMGQVYDYQRGPLRTATRGRRGPDDIGSTGVGAYQFESQTLKGNARAVFGEGWRDVRFTPETQDRMAEHLWNSVRDHPQALANTWAAFGPHAPREGAVLRREGFADDGEWATAQTEFEAATAEADRVAMESDRPPTADADPFDPRTWDEDGPAISAGRDWGTEPPMAASRQERWIDALDRMDVGDITDAPGVLFHEAAGPIDVKWGVAGDPDRDFKGGYGLAHIVAKHPEMEAQLDRLPELIEQMTVKQRRPERMVLESPDHEAAIALTWHGEDRRWLVTAYGKGEAPAGPASVREPKGGGTGSSRPGVAREILPDSDQSKAAELLRQDWMRQVAQGQAPEPTWAMRPEGGGDIVHWTGGDRRYIDRAVREWEEPGDFETVKLHAPDSIANPGEIAGFDTPDDVAAARQIDSLDHDLRQWLADDEAAGLVVRMDEEGNVVSAADALADIDADEAAIDAAWRCL